MVRTIAALLATLLTAGIEPEAVELDAGPVSLASFSCRDISRSTIVQRACYDPAQHRLIVSVRGHYRDYCGVAATTVDSLMAAPSMGQFFRQAIERPGRDGRYDCLAPAPPSY